MKNFYIFFFAFYVLFNVRLWSQCPDPDNNWYRTITKSTYRWYWDEDLNGAAFRKYCLWDYSQSEAKTLVINAINAAVNAWKGAVNSRGTIITDMSRVYHEDSSDFKIQFTSLDPGYLGFTPTPHLIQLTNDSQNYSWTGRSQVADSGCASYIYSILLHEMGHLFLGPGHGNDPNSIMQNHDGKPYQMDACDYKMALLFYNSLWYLTIDNNFTDNNGSNKHGVVVIDTSTYIVPTTIARLEGTSVSLTAVSPQTDNQGYQRIWSDGTYLTISEWRQNDQYKTSNQNYNPIIHLIDDGSLFKAFLRSL